MLILPKSCFLHVAKTGGTWARAAIKASGIEYEEYSFEGDIHADLKHCPCPEKYKIAFVRHPLKQYRSYWQFKMGTGWDWKNPIDRFCCSPGFHDFVRNVLEKFPGIISQYFENYVGSPGAEIEFIGKYENLVNDLVMALKRAGEIFDEETVRNYPPVNVSEHVRFPAEYTKELKEAVIKSEWRAMERFGYE